MANENGELPEDTSVARASDGRWLPGTRSPNPGGQPKASYRLTELARERTEEVIETLAGIMQDPAEPAAARIRACEVLLDRGYGRPRQTGGTEGNAPMGPIVVQFSEAGDKDL